MMLSFSVPRPPDVVFACLTNPEKFVAAHPVIYRLEPLGGDRYRVFEKLALGPLAVAFTYPATITGDVARRTVTMRALVARLVRIEMQFFLEPHGAGTIVREQVHFRSRLPVQAVLRRLFTTLHGQLFAAIGRVD